MIANLSSLVNLTRTPPSQFPCLRSHRLQLAIGGPAKIGLTDQRWHLFSAHPRFEYGQGERVKGEGVFSSSTMVEKLPKRIG